MAEDLEAREGGKCLGTEISSVGLEFRAQSGWAGRDQGLKGLETTSGCPFPIQREKGVRAMKTNVKRKLGRAVGEACVSVPSHSLENQFL